MLRQKGTVRVLSRHPSHNAIRNQIPVKKTTSGRYQRVVLRLGSCTSTTNYDLEINTVEAIQNSMNKLEMKMMFKEAGISSPNFYILFPDRASLSDTDGNKEVSFEELITLVKYPVIAKLTYRSRGNGMLKLDDEAQLLEFINREIRNNTRRFDRNPYYLEEFKNFSREYRIHVSELGGYFYTCRKMLKSEFVGTEDNWYRNDSNCNWFVEDNELFDKPATWDAIVEDCQKAREVLGLSICCFDVKVNKKGEWTILEANSAPSFGEITAIKYIEEIKKIIEVNNERK